MPSTTPLAAHGGGAAVDNAPTHQSDIEHYVKSEGRPDSFQSENGSLHKTHPDGVGERVNDETGFGGGGRAGGGNGHTGTIHGRVDGVIHTDRLGTGGNHRGVFSGTNEEEKSPPIETEWPDVGADMGAFDETAWNDAFAPETIAESDNIPEINTSGYNIQEKWYRNKDNTWRGYYVKRFKGIVRKGPTAGQLGKCTDPVRGSRIVSRDEPKRTRGGKHGRDWKTKHGG